MAKTIQLRAEIKDYTNRVLGVIKEKYGLRDKSGALDKFAELCGDDFVEKEIRDEFIEETLKVLEEHKKKYPKRRMSLKELDKLTRQNV